MNVKTCIFISEAPTWLHLFVTACPSTLSFYFHVSSHELVPLPHPANKGDSAIAPALLLARTFVSVSAWYQDTLHTLPDSHNENQRLSRQERRV